MWDNGLFMYKLAVCLSMVMVSDPEPTGVGFPAAHTPLYGDADSNIEFRVRGYVGSEPGVSYSSPSQCRELSRGGDMSKLWSSLRFEDQAQLAKWDVYSKTAPKKKGAISNKATNNMKYLESLKLSSEDVQKESTQVFLRSKKDALKGEINKMSNEFDQYMDEILGFLISLEAQDEDSVKTIELIKEDIMAEKVKYSAIVLSHQAALDSTYQPVIPSLEARSDNGDTLPVSPVKPIIRADLAPSRLLSISSTPSELEEWVEGIEAWMTGMYLDRSRWEPRVVAEARHKLERDLSTRLGLRFNYTTGSWTEMVESLRQIFLLHYPLLKRRFAVFQRQNGGEDLVSFCT